MKSQDQNETDQMRPSQDYVVRKGGSSDTLPAKRKAAQLVVVDMVREKISWTPDSYEDQETVNGAKSSASSVHSNSQATLRHLALVSSEEGQSLRDGTGGQLTS